MRKLLQKRISFSSSECIFSRHAVHTLCSGAPQSRKDSPRDERSALSRSADLAASDECFGDIRKRDRPLHSRKVAGHRCSRADVRSAKRMQIVRQSFVEACGSSNHSRDLHGQSRGLVRLLRRGQFERHDAEQRAETVLFQWQVDPFEHAGWSVGQRREVHRRRHAELALPERSFAAVEIEHGWSVEAERIAMPPGSVNWNIDTGAAELKMRD